MIIIFIYILLNTFLLGFSIGSHQLVSLRKNKTSVALVVLFGVIIYIYAIYHNIKAIRRERRVD